MRLSGKTEQWELECARARYLIKKYFGSLEFKEDTHQYFLPQPDGTKKEYDCVSHFTKQWDPEEDWDEIRRRYAQKHGQTPEYWKEKWDFNAKVACTNGTTVHEFAESCGWLSNGESDRICPSAMDQFDPDTYSLIPYNKKDKWMVKDDEDDWTRWVRKEQAVRDFWDNRHPSIHLCMAETKVYTSVGPFAEQYNNNYAGTFDLLTYYQHPTDPSKSGFIVEDYKTNSSLRKDFKKNLLPPFEDYNEEPLSHYTMQLSCYQIPLEAIGLKVIGRRLIWLKNEGGFEVVPVPDVTDKIKDALRGPYKEIHVEKKGYNEEKE